MGFLGSSIINSKNLETRYNEVASKGSRLDAGIHEVTISSVELDKERRTLKLNFKGSEDKFHTQYLWLIQKVFDRSQGRLLDDKEEVSTGYIQLNLGLGLNFEQALELLFAANDNTALFQALTGLKCKIKLQQSKYGVVLNRNDEGKIVIVDAGSGKFVSAIEHLVKGRTFDSFSDAQDFIKSTERALKIAYLEVNAVMEISEEVSNANREAIQTALKASASTTSSNVASIL